MGGRGPLWTAASTSRALCFRPMTTFGRLPALALIGLVATTTALSACGQSEISEAELEATVATQLAEEVDQPEPNIDCPGPLAAEVGATTECELSVDGDDAVYPVAVEVTSIDGDSANFDIEVGTEPISGGDGADAPEEDPADSPAEGGEQPGDETEAPADGGAESGTEDPGY